eukprot:TRINITY_DN62772_c0_g1_i1.p1 TRINITY_DN62772_c0_g1~~TRINITY_DN62772_c0_g1_i1.p1  ORF type:complete len:321 (-),score=97.11 TRINITY_DN62772_c0_g1_i1:258-1169(-)
MEAMTAQYVQAPPKKEAAVVLPPPGGAAAANAAAAAAGAAPAALASGVEQQPNKLFVGGISKTSTEASISTFFGQFGAIQELQMKYDDWGGFRGFGFITFADAASVDAVVANGENNILDGKWVDCKPAMKGLSQAGGKGKDAGYGKAGKGGCGGEEVVNPRKLFIGGLPREATEETLTAFFQQFGAIEKLDVKMDAATGGSRGFGFVIYSDEAAAQAVLRNGPNNYIGEKWIDCKAATQSANKGMGKWGGKGWDAWGKGDGWGTGDGWGKGGGWGKGDGWGKGGCGGYGPAATKGMKGGCPYW